MKIILAILALSLPSCIVGLSFRYRDTELGVQFDPTPKKDTGKNPVAGK